MINRSFSFTLCCDWGMIENVLYLNFDYREILIIALPLPINCSLCEGCSPRSQTRKVFFSFVKSPHSKYYCALKKYSCFSRRSLAWKGYYYYRDFTVFDDGNFLLIVVIFGSLLSSTRRMFNDFVLMYYVWNVCKSQPSCEN